MEACKYGSLFRRGHPEDPVQGRYIIFDETGSFRFSEGEGYFHFETDFTSGMEIVAPHEGAWIEIRRMDNDGINLECEILRKSIEH